MIKKEKNNKKEIKNYIEDLIINYKYDKYINMYKILNKDLKEIEKLFYIALSDLEQDFYYLFVMEIINNVNEYQSSTQ